MSKCQQCADYEYKQATGHWPNDFARNRWALFGCTCDPQRLEEFLDYWKAVTT